MKTTKTQARACYDEFHNTLRWLNGGTRDENERNAPQCRAELARIVEQAKALAANPSKVLAADAWLMDALTRLPVSFEAWCDRYPERSLAPVVPFTTE